MKSTKNPQRKTSSMTSPIAKRLRPLLRRISVTLVDKRSSTETKSKPKRKANKVQITNMPSSPIRGHAVTPVQTNAQNKGCTTGNSHGQVATVPSQYQYYHPAPPSTTSSICSEWLLIFPGLRTDIPPLPADVIRNLDYRLRYTAK